MFVWLRVHGFESSVNKVFQKEKLANLKTRIYSPQLKGLSSAGTNLVHMPHLEISRLRRLAKG